MPDYQKGKIYKIYSVSNEELVYYGSTTKTLSRRLANHIYDYNCGRGCNTSCKIIFDANDYKMELIENYSCANKQQLTKKEGEYIKNNVCVNKRIEGRKHTKEYMKEYNKQYRDNNKEYLVKKSKEKITCKCGCLIVEANISKHQKTPKHIKLMEEKNNLGNI
tara:strand:- start:21 stop:509 length:489 start_codon:yes stop_codon:yes gene_type:complete